LIPPPLLDAELPLMVDLMAVTDSAWIPPPTVDAVLPLTLELVSATEHH
jgi:hypothetical protein